MSDKIMDAEEIKVIYDKIKETRLDMANEIELEVINERFNNYKIK